MSQILRKTKKNLVLKALEGHYSDEGIFMLKQAYDAYMFYQHQMKECDKKLNDLLIKITKDKEEDTLKPLEKKVRKHIRHNKPEIDDLGEHLMKICGGKDATEISGITDYTWLKLIVESGTNLSKWKTEKHYTSWLGLSLGQHHSGKMRRSKKKGKPAAGQIFKIIAQGLINSKNIAIGAFGRRIRAKKGSPVAIKAMARKLAIQYWRLMVHGKEFV